MGYSIEMLFKIKEIIPRLWIAFFPNTLFV